MLVLGINSSPRIDGNCATLLHAAMDSAAAAGARVETIDLAPLVFSPCRACDDAPRDGACLLRDDWQSVAGAIKTCDTLVLASPIFFGSVSAQAKMMIDRFQCCWAARFLHKTVPPSGRRPGAFICASAQNRPEFLHNAAMVIANFFAAARFTLQEKLYCPGLEQRGDAAQAPAFLTQASALGRRLAGESK